MEGKYILKWKSLEILWKENGMWEIKKKKKNEVDWNKKGEMVKNRKKELIRKRVR